MKKLDEVPQEVLNLIKTEHEKALTLLSGQSPILTLPTRSVKMRVDRPSKGYQLEDVIVPKTLIYYKGDNLSNEKQCDTNGLIFHLELTKKPFPYGHIYMSSGSICLGGIFVPSKISIYNLSQPLEAMFLLNDHNTAHGGARAEITTDELLDISRIISKNKIITSEDVKNTLKVEANLIANDAVWILSSEINSQVPSEKAKSIMDEIFRIIFTEK